jgi:hypothetical protein
MPRAYQTMTHSHALSFILTDGHDRHSLSQPTSLTWASPDGLDVSGDQSLVRKSAVERAIRLSIGARTKKAVSGKRRK